MIVSFMMQKLHRNGLNYHKNRGKVRNELDEHVKTFFKYWKKLSNIINVVEK